MTTAATTDSSNVMALLIAGIVLAGCAGTAGAPSSQDGPGTGSVTSAPAAASVPARAQSAGTSGSTSKGIPDGTWARKVTAAEIARRGLKLTPEETTSNYLDDGTVEVVLKIQGKRWSILVQDDAGEFEVGDLGDTSYDNQGRWVQSSDITGDALVLTWHLNGNSLVTSGLTSPSGEPIAEDDAHVFTEGTWQRQG